MAKRAFDFLAAGAGLVLLSPVLLAIALAVTLDSPGGVFYRHERVGRGGRPFRMLKFRTMVADADRRGGPLTVGGDARITRVGAWLRASKLDELPQLVNVVRGDMALVGPRPEVARYVQHFTPAQRRVLDVRPGITDPASIAYRHESEELARHDDPERAYLEIVLPRKLELNLAYLERRTFWSDLRLLFATLAAVARRPVD